MNSGLCQEDIYDCEKNVVVKESNHKTMAVSQRVAGQKEVRGQRQLVMGSLSVG